MKENLNIQLLLFKYLVLFLIYASFNFSYQILHSFFLFSFVFNVILRLSRILESIKYHVNACERFFLLLIFLKTPFIWYGLNDFNKCAIRM